MNRDVGCGLELVDLGPGDVSTLATLDAACFSSPWRKESFETMLDVPGTGGSMLLQLAREDSSLGANQALAYSLFRRIAEEAELLRIGVALEHRRRGLASLLLEGMIDQLAGSGVRVIYLEVRQSNTAAIALYQAFGFTQVGTRSKYYENGEDALEMALLPVPSG